MSSTNAPHEGHTPDSPSDVRALPARPNLEFERKQAKKLLASLKKGDPKALARVHAKLKHSGDTKPDEFKLADAQFTIAREYGFTSWPRLVEYFGALERHERTGARDRDYPINVHNQQAEGLQRQQHNGRPISYFFATFLPRFYGRDVNVVSGAEVTIDEARLVHARMNRYPSWDALVEGIRPENLPPRNEWTRAGSPDYRAGRAIRSGDLESLGQIIDEKPEMLQRIQSINYPVPSSILHSAVRHELETRTEEARRVTDYLVSRGASLSETLNPMLLSGGFHTKTSDIEYLLDRGADPSWVPPNGIPLIEHAICRYWNGAAVDLLVGRVKPRQAFWISAGLGDVKAVSEYFNRDGTLTVAAREHRPDFTATAIAPMPFLAVAGDQEVIWEAFFVAATNQRFEVLDLLLDRGFPIDYIAWGQTILHLAVGNRWVPLVEYLVRRGANVELRGLNPPLYNAREGAELTFSSLPNDAGCRRILELCSGRDPEVVLKEADEARVKQVTPTKGLLAAIANAKKDANRLGLKSAGLENLFVGLLQEDHIVFRLSHGGVDLSKLQPALADRLNLEAEPDASDVPLDDAASAACMEAQEETKRRRQPHITPIHLLFVLLQSEQGFIADRLRVAGGEPSRVRASLEGSL